MKPVLLGLFCFFFIKKAIWNQNFQTYLVSIEMGFFVPKTTGIKAQ
jgi:hypothetical protein